MSISVRRAAGAGWAVCRALLPEATEKPAPAATGLIALRDGGQKVLGACVLHLDDAQAWLYLRVIRPERRQGIGSLLLDAALKSAADASARRMVVVCDTAAEPAAEPFLLARQFRAGGSFTTFEADLLSSLRMLQATRDRIVAAGRAPDSMRLVPLQEAPQAEVARLFAEYIAHRPDLAHAPILWDENLARWNCSPVVLVDGHVKAALLCEIKDGLAEVPGRMVAREFQGSWANALMLGMAADMALAQGATRFRFVAPPGNKDTLKLARRTNARVLSVRTRFEREIAR